MPTISERATAAMTRQPSQHVDRICPACGQKKPAPRNVERHRLFFSMLGPALDNWPENHEFQPINTEHLRYWLLWKVGHCTARDLIIAGPSKANAVAAVRFFLANDSHSKFYTSTAKGIREYTPKSIAFHKCTEGEFKRILDEAGALLASIVGVPVEKLRREVAA